MLKISVNLSKKFNGLPKASACRKFSDLPDSLKAPSVIMLKDSKHVLCYHPEPAHPFEFTRPIERKIETETPLKSDLSNIYLKRFDDRPATNPDEHWADAIRLGKTFNEHPIIFRKTNRNERKKEFMAKTQPIKKNRESI